MKRIDVDYWFSVVFIYFMAIATTSIAVMVILMVLEVMGKVTL